MTPAEQEYASRRYVAPRLTILPLSCGGFAIGRGFNPPDLLHVAADANELADFVRDAAEREFHRAQEGGARRTAVARASDFSLDLDFDTIDLSEIGL